jgi:hypothetical protein
MEMPPKRRQSSKTNPTGTRSHFVSCIQLRNGIAAVAAIACRPLAGLRGGRICVVLATLPQQGAVLRERGIVLGGFPT